jgi:hypothetical protein
MFDKVIQISRSLQSHNISKKVIIINFSNYIKHWPGFWFLSTLFVVVQICGSTGQSFLPECVQEALPELKNRSLIGRFSNLERIWTEQITKGDLSCQFCMQVVDKMNKGLKTINIKETVFFIILIGNFSNDTQYCSCKLGVL